MKRKMKVKAERTSYSYVTLQNAAKYALESAQLSEKGQFFNNLSAMLYSAFSLEAYLNHLGKSEFSNWEKIQRYKSPKQKLDMLVENRAYRPNFSTRPFDTFGKIFDFRKIMVHGNTESIKVEEVQEREFGDQPELPATSWEKLISLENAVTFVEDSAAMILMLHPVFGYGSDPFSTEWRSLWEAKPL